MGMRWERVKEEFAAVREAMKISVRKRDWKSPPDWLHFYMDVFVENCRHAPYFWGHVSGVGVPIAVIAIVEVAKAL